MGFGSHFPQVVTIGVSERCCVWFWWWGGVETTSHMERRRKRALVTDLRVGQLGQSPEMNPHRSTSCPGVKELLQVLCRELADLGLEHPAFPPWLIKWKAAYCRRPVLFRHRQVEQCWLVPIRRHLPVKMLCSQRRPVEW